MIVKVKVVKDAVIVRPWQLEDLIGIGGAQIEGCVRIKGIFRNLAMGGGGFIFIVLSRGGLALVGTPKNPENHRFTEKGQLFQSGEESFFYYS